MKGLVIEEIPHLLTEEQKCESKCVQSEVSLKISSGKEVTVL